MTDIRSQGSFGSCVAFAVAAALEIVPNSVGITQDEAERFIWYNSKDRDGQGSPDIDRGTYIHTAIDVVKYLGSCWEGQCRYAPNPLARPSPEAYAAASNMKVTQALRLAEKSIDGLRGMLSIGWPVIVGFEIFGSGAERDYLFGEYTKQTGIMKMPPTPLRPVTAGHAALFVGYDDNSKRFKFKNSWGPTYGDRGYYYMPYDYVQYTSDAWVLWQQNIHLPVITAGVSATILGAAGYTDVEGIKINDGVQPLDAPNQPTLTSQSKT
ncbi:hypothetical protein CNMCM8980_003201 [Aspergillus fumigatiaffinis]|nr:hypothetical protein CNMCM8980_003201 [Aspergillus fumigatiaffinis]